MEKLSIVISDLFHNEEVSFLISGIVGFLVGTWPMLYPFRMRLLTEDELEKISPKFKWLDLQYILFMGLWFIFVRGLISSNLNDWAISTYGVGYYPFIEIAMAGFGLFHASLALWKGVYPQGRVMTYVYGDEKKIRRIAMAQIVIAIAMSILSVAMFNILGAYFNME